MQILEINIIIEENLEFQKLMSGAGPLVDKYVHYINIIKLCHLCFNSTIHFTLKGILLYYFDSFQVVQNKLN